MPPRRALRRRWAGGSLWFSFKTSKEHRIVHRGCIPSRSAGAVNLALQTKPHTAQGPPQAIFGPQCGFAAVQPCS